MINQIINWFFMTVTPFVQGVAAEHMLETNPHTKKWLRLGFWVLHGGITSAINIWGQNVEGTMGLRMVLSASSYILTLVFFYRGAVWLRIVALVALHFGMASSELIMLLIIYTVNASPEELLMICLDRTKVMSVVFIGLGTCVSILAITCIVVLWKRFIHRGKTMKYLPVFLVWIFCHEVSLLIMEFSFLRGNYEQISGYTFLVSTICMVVMLVIMFSQSEKETMESNLRETKQKAELERISHQEIANRREKLMQFSRDNRGIIQNTESLLRSGEVKKAEHCLEQLLENISQTKEYPYCGIPIVNVVLSEKKKECEKYEIAMDAEIRIPDQMKIEQMDICSILGNMMDNAIRACKHSDTGAEIKLTAGTAGEYFIIKCENTSKKAPGKNPEGTGYGLKILRDIAERYEGELMTKYEGGRFYTQMSVRFR